MRILRTLIRIQISLATLLLLPQFAFAQWIPDGAPVCSASQDQSSQQMTSDGSGGAIITWQDYRNGGYDIYAQRIDEDGFPLWTPDGIPVCTLSASGQGEPQIVSDGAGGAIYRLDG